MSTKSTLLSMLEQRKGAWVSGEEVAEGLGVSRAAVWKAMKALRAQGLIVESAPGSGYRLAPGSDLLSLDAVSAYLPQPAPALRVLEEVDSTNLEAKRWAMEGAPHGAMVLAARQTAGRGRLGRGFESPRGGLYASVVLRPQQGFEDSAILTALAAVAVSRAVAEECGLELSIKWVNDLFYENKKCVGILTEAVWSMESGLIESIVVGIGVNYTTPQSAFAGQLGEVGTSLYPDGEAPVTRAKLAAGIYNNLMQLYDALPDRQFLFEYRRRSLAPGRQVTVMAPQPYTATALRVDDNAQLVVQMPSGEMRTLSYGEIGIRL